MGDKMDQKILAKAAKHFELFYASEVFADILNNFATVCELVNIQPSNFVNFYPELKPQIKSCQAVNLFKLLDERAKNPIFNENMAAANIKMTVVGAGPIGLRTAIEAQLLGARVTVIEKRTSVTRNNVLHLWPWVIEDLKSLGAKSFYPRFCTGTMNHISIKRLQCVLLKTALCFGVEVVGGVEFKDVIEPQFNGDPWRISVSPEDSPVSGRPVDVLIGAEGKRVTVPGFRRKEFRGKLAIAITANFKNKRTTAEAVVEEISGVAFVYKQDFFNTLYEEFGIALENIVYYKDDTHYFVMTTKKHSLLDRDVLKKDTNDPIALLSPKNVNKDNLLEYIRDACDYCTDYQLPHLEFAINHHGEPDVALFDFTSMFASGNGCHVIEKNNRQLVVGLVGDGLLEPFWPTGTGIARGFLGAFDAVWMVRQWASGDMSPSEVIAERESILKLLPQTTQENITKDFKNMTILPSTRYPNIPRHLYSTVQVGHLYQSDTPQHADIPRYSHPMFEEVISRVQLVKASGGRLPVNSSLHRIKRDLSDDVPEPSKAQQMSDAKANDFYQAMREKRRNELANEKNNEPKTKTSTKNNSNNNKTSSGIMSLKDRIAARRAALDMEPSKKTEEKNILKDKESKAEFVKKMSKTFGYGKPSSTESKPDTLEAEADNCALPVKVSTTRNTNENKLKKKERKKSGDKTGKKEKKSTKVPTSREREIPAWDFTKTKNEKNLEQSLHSSVAPIVPELDIEIDPELDFLLASLEQDDHFSQLGENDQKAWLESLFFQDTKNLPGRIGKADLPNPRDQLTKTKSGPKINLRVNSDRQMTKKDVTDPETVTAVHVNDKMKNLAQDFFKPSNKETIRKTSKDISSLRESRSPSLNISPSLSRKSSIQSFCTPPTSRKTSEYKEPPRKNSTIEDSFDEISGINKNLCSLAQSYFKGDSKTPADDNQNTTENQASEDVESEGKANLVASFFSNTTGSLKQNNKAMVTKQRVPERVSYEPPEDGEVVEEEDNDDDEIENLIRAARKEMGNGDTQVSVDDVLAIGDAGTTGPPLPPRRSADNKAISMMRCLSNITGIMQGKNS